MYFVVGLLLFLLFITITVAKASSGNYETLTKIQTAKTQ